MAEDNTPVEHVIQTEQKVRKVTDYEIELRNEAANTRRERDADKAKYEETIRAMQADHYAKLAEAGKAADKRYLRAKVEAAALRHGMHDPDAVKMLDLSSLSLTDAGDIQGLDELFAESKKSKPYLYGPVSTSSTQPVPRSEPSKALDLRTASDAEVLAFERKMGISR